VVLFGREVGGGAFEAGGLGLVGGLAGRGGAGESVGVQFRGDPAGSPVEDVAGGAGDEGLTGGGAGCGSITIRVGCSEERVLL